MLVSQWAGISFGVLDTAMTGHASPTDLAAMALSASIYITIFVGLMGVVHALIPILAQHFGAGNNAEVGRSWGQGVWLALGLSVVGAILMLFPDVWLSMSGDVAPDVRERIASYLRALVLAMPAALVFRTIYALGTAVSRPAGDGDQPGRHRRQGPAQLVFIYGKLGLPALARPAPAWLPPWFPGSASAWACGSSRTTATTAASSCAWASRTGSR